MAANLSTSALLATRRIQRVAVCGAGVMGAQIAAHCLNAGLSVVLYDLAGKTEQEPSLAQQARAHLAKIRPAPLADAQMATRIHVADYEQDLALLAECDLIIEAVAERLDIKQALYERLAPHVADHALIASNTSGLSIASLAAVLPEGLRHRFCGVHFFNPPRYMTLVELIPGPDTDPDHLDTLESFLAHRLGKGVVRAHDTPNFIANRIGVFGLLATFAQAQQYELTYEQVDALTGTKLGRAKSGTYRTADVVGLDTLAHVIRTMQEHLPDDPFAALFAIPVDLQHLLDNQAYGQKSGVGYYKKIGRDILRYDPSWQDYVPADHEADAEVLNMLAEPDVGERLQALRASPLPQAQFVWAVLRDLFHYSAVHVAEIADTTAQVDWAMRWGFGHKQGPFELWQAAGWERVAKWLQEDIDQGRTLAAVPLPDWVFHPEVLAAEGVQQPKQVWSPRQERFVTPETLPIYQRQWRAPVLVGQAAQPSREVVYDTEMVQAYHVNQPNAEGVLVVQFNSKMHTLGPDVVEGLFEVIDLAERDYLALVIAQDGEPFSAGADLKAMLPLVEHGGPEAAEAFEKRLQDMVMRVRYAQVPVVAALAGLALGGGCELAVHAAERVAHLETYIGLVEVGIGLIPGAGGLTYCARRAAELQQQGAPEAPLLAYLKRFALNIANAKVSTSAVEAKQMGYLLESDPIVLQRNELLYVAIQRARALALSGWQPPVPQAFPAAGRDALATLRVQIENLRVGGYASDYDAYLATQVATVLCGGDLDPNTLVDEPWLLQRERDAFVHLLGQPKTQERIRTLLTNGKAVRN